jgi:hypothetical protein
MLYLQHDFYNITFKIKHTLYIASGSATGGGGGPPAADPEAIYNLCLILKVML